MPDTRISALTAITAAETSDADLLPIVDQSAGANRKMTFGEAKAALSVDAVAAKTAAETAQAAAELAEVNAEAARDAAMLSAGVYADTTAGLAATVSGQYFSVPSGVTSEYLILYLNSAGTAVEVKRYPSALLVDDIGRTQRIAGINDWAASVVYSAGNIAYTGVTADIASYWSNDLAGATGNDEVHSVEINTTGSLAGRIVVIDSTFHVTHDQAFSVTGAGDHVITPAPAIQVTPGSRLFVKPDTANLSADIAGTATAIYFGATNYSGVVGDYVTAPIRASSADVSIKVNWIGNRLRSVTGRLDDSAIVNNAQFDNPLTGDCIPPFSAEWVVGTPSIAGIVRAFDAGVDVPVGALVQNVVAHITTFATASSVRLMLLKRDTAIGDAIWNFDTDGSEFQSHSWVPAVIDANVGGTTTGRVVFPVEPFVVEEGKTYFAILYQLDSNFSGVNMRASYSNDARETRQRNKGWYFVASTIARFTSGLPVGGAATLRVGLEWKAALARPLQAGSLRIADASMSISGTAAKTTAILDDGTRRYGATGSATLALAATGLVRYDVVWFNPLTWLFGVVTGTERAVEPAEYVPVPDSPTKVPLFHVRVDDAGHTWVPIWNLTAGEAQQYREDLIGQRERSRNAIRGALSKISCGVNLHIVGIGDSIMAWQSSIPSKATPNGAFRDTESYLSAYGSDYLSGLTNYTAVELGLADDGAGSIHVALSQTWQLVTALRAAGASVTYDNFAVGSMGFADIVGSTPPYAATAWYQAALNLGGDLLILHFGMNNYTSTTVADQCAAAISMAKAAGYEVLVIGCPRKHSSVHVQSSWTNVNAQLRLAAEYGGAAFLDVAALYEDDALGVMGITNEDCSEANKNNHPGVREHAVMGSALLRLFE